MAHSQSYSFVSYPEPHVARTRAILKAHPEVTALFGNSPFTFFFVLLVVALQVGTAWAVSAYDVPWWGLLLIAYTLGAVVAHAMWTLIHDATHNLIFKSAWANQAAAILANFAFLFPSAISFRIYHIKHHLYQGDFDRDADLPRPFEARLVSNIWWRKALFLLTFAVSQIFRVPFLKGIAFLTPWTVANMVVHALYLFGLWHLAGWTGIGYLALASAFGIGLHPLGARWIQEHYTVVPGQETYSYYGPLNLVSFNVGYHNEHHDFMRVAWWRLPKVRALAPEFYDTLHFHTSWTGLLFKFIFDPKLSLYNRVVRGDVAESLSRKPAAASVEELIAQGTPARA